MTKLTKIAAVLTVSLNVLGFALPASAGKASTMMPVSVTVINSCTITSQALSFGSYKSNSGSSLDSTAMLLPFCSHGTDYAISLDAGIGGDAKETARQLTGSSGGRLAYGIYTDVARSSIWGSGSGGTRQIFGTGNGQAQPVIMYARIPATQKAPAGTYTDTVTVTVNY